MNFRFTDDERDRLRDEVARILFVQHGLTRGDALITSTGFAGKAIANGVAIDLGIVVENIVTEHLNGLTAAQGSKR